MNDNKFIEISDYESVSPDYLMHYQLKGAKWGVHRGPPYPLRSGLNTSVKKVTKDAKKRAERDGTKLPTVERRSGKKGNSSSAEDRIKRMTNEELRKEIERMKLETEYRNLLPKEKKGESFMKRSASKLKELNALGTEVSNFVAVGKGIAKAFGLTKTTSKEAEFNWKERLPGENAEQYSKRLTYLKNIKNNKKLLADLDAQEESDDFSDFIDDYWKDTDKKKK